MRNCDLFTWVRPGRQSTVLFLHGLTGSGESWRPVLQGLPAVTAVGPDLLGFGRSPKPETAKYDVETHLDCLAPLIERHNPVAVVGHSMGAVLALGVLSRWPSVRTAALISPAVYASAADARRSMRSAPLLHRLTLRSRFTARLLCEMTCAVRPLLQAIAPTFSRDVPPSVARASMDHTWTSYSRNMDQIVTAGLVPQLLEGVGKQVFILHGLGDKTVPVASVSGLRSAVRKLELVDGDHLLPLRRPAAVAEFILRTQTAR